ARVGRIPPKTVDLSPSAPMRRTLCKSKIHRGILTGADLHYEGSLTVDRELMDAADLRPYEKVQVVNVNTGSRLETYVIEGEAGSGTLQLNGAAARLGMAGDHVIVISYAEYEESEIADDFEPLVVFVDEGNRIRQPRIRTAS
ncbi:MAG TPA: aspartate 1-decarboxylase, partial [Gemmatimonadaceae bacterium]|nr:aspartate 1-decarboxylase [Gemmatimonadaceae bacterium]